MDIGGAFSAITKPFRKPEGYVSAAQEAKAAAPAPVAAPASTQLGGMNMTATQRREKAAGLANGGSVGRYGARRPGASIVQGPGTGTSDSVPATVPPKTFILPADSTEEVNLSKGELKIMPEVVMAAGTAALQAVLDATHSPVPEKGGKANGGAVRAGAKRKNCANGGVIDPNAPTPTAAPAPQPTAAPVAATGYQGYQADLDARNSATSASSFVNQQKGYGATPKPANTPTPGMPAVGAVPAPASPSLGATPPVGFEADLAQRNSGVKSIFSDRPGYEHGGSVKKKDDEPGGAVFGMYPAAAGTRLSTHATDARLRTGYTGDGAPAVPVVRSAQQGLPAGVQPSAAGAGRGKVNPQELGAIPATAVAGAGPTPTVPVALPPVAAPVPVAALPTEDPLAAQPAAPAQTSQDRIGIYNRAGQTYREIAAMQLAGNQTPAGMGMTVGPDRQAERNLQFDAQTLRDQAIKRGGRGAGVMMVGAERLDERASRAAIPDNVRAIQASQAAAAATAQKSAADLQREEAREAGADRRAAPAAAESAQRIGVSRDQQDQTRAVARLQAKFATTTDPAERTRLREQIMLAQGKEPAANRYTVVPGGQTVDPTTGQVVREPAQVLDNQTGQLVNTAGAAAKPAAMPPKDKLVSGQTYQTPRGPARWDGSKFMPV